MASGKIWSGTLAAGIAQDTGAVPAGKVRTATISAVNYGTAAATLKVYVGASATPDDAACIEPEIALPVGGVYKLTGEIIGEGERIVLLTDGNAIAARVAAFEETA